MVGLAVCKSMCLCLFSIYTIVAITELFEYISCVGVGRLSHTWRFSSNDDCDDAIAQWRI